MLNGPQVMGGDIHGIAMHGGVEVPPPPPPYGSGAKPYAWINSDIAYANAGPCLGDPVLHHQSHGDNEDSTAASSGADEHQHDEGTTDDPLEKYNSLVITEEQRADPLFHEKLAAHLHGTCKPCFYACFKEDSCRNGNDCDHCHFCTKEDATRRKRVEKREARTQARRREREKAKEIRKSAWMQVPERDDTPGDLYIAPECLIEDKSHIRPNILEALETTEHEIDTCNAKKWLCMACNETCMLSQHRHLAEWLARPCVPGPPPWMHPTHTYTRDVGKIMCSVCRGFSNGMRVAPRLRKPCQGAPCIVAAPGVSTRDGLIVYDREDPVSYD